jgi:hypothetical protein
MIEPIQTEKLACDCLWHSLRTYRHAGQVSAGSFTTPARAEAPRLSYSLIFLDTR